MSRTRGSTYLICLLFLVVWKWPPWALHVGTQRDSLSHLMWSESCDVISRTHIWSKLEFLHLQRSLMVICPALPTLKNLGHILFEVKDVKLLWREELRSTISYILGFEIYHVDTAVKTMQHLLLYTSDWHGPTFGRPLFDLDKKCQV